MQQVLAIARITLLELIRSKALYSVFFFAAAMVSAAAIFGSVTIGDQVLVIKDFGLFSISICSVAFAVIGGASLLEKELTKKTVYNILSRPLARGQFILGKYLGMLGTICIIVALMMAALQTFLFFFTYSVDGRLWLGAYSIILEAAIICAAALLFSSIVVTPLLSGLFTFGLFVVGRSVDYLLYFIEQGTLQGVLASILKATYYLLPQLSKLQVSNELVFGIDEQLSARLSWGSIYSVAYSAILLAIAVLIFRRREFN